MWIQKEITLAQKRRGIHIITDEILKNIPELREVKIGLLNLFIRHTSASLTINENVSPDVRSDMERILNRIVPENTSFYQHTMEGPDDMPAHIKSSLLGCSLTIPVKEGELSLGIWQGIYLCEHRDNGGSRKIVATINY